MDNTKPSYEYWRTRILYSTMIGYVFFYFVRKNLSMATPGIIENLDVTKEQIGIILTAHGLLYGLSRFCNGILADRVNPRYFMAAGLLLCAITNFGFGMSNVFWCMAIFWIANGWFQGMGFPPCAKSLTHWFAAEERGIKFSIWNTSHSVGAGILFLLCAGIMKWIGDWRFCFFIPATIGVVGAFFLLNRLRDTPESMGLDSVEAYHAKKLGIPVEVVEEAIDGPGDEEGKESWGMTLQKHVFGNPAIWVISFANFFVYVVRFSILDWAPTFLKEAKGLEIHQAGVVSCFYELVGVTGMLASGYLMDKVFRGRGAKVCCLYMLGCTVTMSAFWFANSNSPVVNALFLAVLGFFIYGPQCLIGVVAANLATKKAAAAANGLTGIFGYLSVIYTGYFVGMLSEHFDWNVVFLSLIGASFLAMTLFLFVLNAAAPEQLAAEERIAEKDALE